MFGRKDSKPETDAPQNGITAEAVIEALRPVNDPELHRSLVELGMIKDVRACGSSVAFEVELTTPACPLKAVIEKDCRDAVSKIPGVENIDIKFSSQVRTPKRREALPGVKHVIAVASGKGGVGKSTVSINLASALAASGAKVGLLDADIYGPSLPLMLDINVQPLVENVMDTVTGEIKRKMVPPEKYDLKLMSLGFLAPGDKAVIWRGPMVASAVSQMLTDTHWEDLDYLVVDLPPGTGDAPMSLVQQVPLSGVVIVMTPQDVALTIATKSLRMFQSDTLKVPILGIVENMSTFICPNCQHESDIFGHSGTAEKAAEQLGVRFLGRIPLDPRVVSDTDRGRPTFIIAPESAPGMAYQSIAQQVAAEISVQSLTKPNIAPQPVEFINL